MVDFSVSVPVFTILHGHFPGHAIATALLNVVAVVFLRRVFCVGFIGLEESVFQITQFDIERETFDNFAFLSEGVGCNNHDSRA